MSLQISLPLGNKQSVKNLVFTILTHEYPLKLIQLTNYIRKRYGKAVTFQAVRKAVLELVEEKVILRQDNDFLINREWVKQSKEVMDNLYNTIYEEKSTQKKTDAIGEEISVFTFSSLNEMMKFWEDLITNWFEKFKQGDPNINCWRGAHGWEALLHSDTEKRLMEKLKHKGIKSYTLSTGNTPLDKIAMNLYKQIGLKVSISKSSSQFDKSYYVGTYGDLIVQTQYPLELTKELDEFFKKNKNLENLNLKELSDIVNNIYKSKNCFFSRLTFQLQISRKR